MIGLALAAAIAAAQPAPAERLPYSVVFARERLGPWRVDARTLVEDVAGLPMISSTECRVERPGLSLVTWQDGGLSLQLAGGNREMDLHFGSEDIRRVALDERVWAVRWVTDPDDVDQFRDVTYPPPPPCPGCIAARSGSWRMQRRPRDPWLPYGTLTNELLEARMLRIGFVGEAEDGGREGPLLWASVPLTGLGEALAWCRAAMASERARLFHAGVGE
jgi:hypothetical protein